MWSSALKLSKEEAWCDIPEHPSFSAYSGGLDWCERERESRVRNTAGWRYRITQCLVDGLGLLMEVGSRATAFTAAKD